MKDAEFIKELTKVARRIVRNASTDLASDQSDYYAREAAQDIAEVFKLRPELYNQLIKANEEGIAAAAKMSGEKLANFEPVSTLDIE